MQNVSPNCEALVSPDLIRLIRGLELAVDEPVAQAPVVETQVETAASHDAVKPDPALVDDPPAPEAELGPHKALNLRIDGARPLHLCGSEICKTELRQTVTGRDGFEDQITGRLRLIGTDDGRVIAHVAAEPGSSLSARPVYRAAEVWAASDVASLVAAAIGDACFGTTPPGHHHPGLTLSAPPAGHTGIHLPLGSPPTQEIAQ